jgi:hypothetical protein
MSIKSFSDYLTENTKEVSFVFGRFNPPTIGHEKLFDALKKQSRGGSYRIYASKSVDAKKNPLQPKDKIKFIRKMFPKHARNIMADSDVRTVLDIAVKLYDQGFTKVTMVAGSDRVREFDILLNKYNGQKAKHGFYNFEGAINVVSAGDRDPDAEGATGMSASKMRMSAQQNDLAGFAKGVPARFHPTDLFNAVRKGMGLKLENTFRQHVELPIVSETREEYVGGGLFEEGDIVNIKDSSTIGKIIVCGTNYVIVESELGKKRYWLDAVELVEYNEVGTPEYTKYLLKNTPQGKPTIKLASHCEAEDPDIGDRKGTQPKDYYAKDAEGKKMAKSTKAKRAAHFKKKSTKPAPGDATAKTKPSTHTKKYKQMYGEWNEHLSFEDYIITEGKADAALKKKADKSGMPLGILRQVFNRGVAAWKTGHRPGTTAVQWGLARVNSFVTKSSGTWGKADKDLAAKV